MLCVSAFATGWQPSMFYATQICRVSTGTYYHDVFEQATGSSALRPSGSPGAKIQAAAAHIATVALAAHPFRQLYLSGAALASSSACVQIGLL